MITKKELRTIRDKVKKHGFGIASATGRISSAFLVENFVKELNKLFALHENKVKGCGTIERLPSGWGVACGEMTGIHQYLCSKCKVVDHEKPEVEK